MTRSAVEDEEEKARKGEENDDDDYSVSVGHIFDILRTIKCKDSCYELLIGIQGLHTLLCHADFTFATLFGYVHLITRYIFIYLAVLWGSCLS